MKKNSKTNQSTEEKKNEKKMTNADLMQFLGKYDSIIKDKMISDNAKKVLSCLLYVSSKQNESFTIGQRTISELTGVPKNKISANIAILVDKGFINCNVGERGKNSEYSINYEAMKSYVSLSVPSVPKCTEKVSQVSQSVPSVPNNEGTVNRTVEGTPKDAEIQRVMKRIEVYQKCINEDLGTLKKMLFGDINININNNINKNLNNLKDNISSNNNTEGNITREQEKKKNISTGNLEKLKENSNDEIFNDEDIQRENESLDEDKDNISKVKSSNDENLNESRIPSESRIETRDNISTDNISNNENLNESRISDLVDMYFNQTNIPNDNIPSESRIPSEDNISTDENPNDMPPLDVDCFFEDSNSTEYRNNENLNEENENSKEDENPSKANGSSNEDGGLNEDKNPSDENPSKANENPEDDEMDCSVFGDSNSTDEDNDKWYESSRSSKSDNHANGMFTNLISELTSNENPKTNEISNDNNLKTSENMKKTNNKTNTIQSEGKNPSDEKTLKNLNAFGKLQSFRDLNTGRIDGYQFNSYDNLNDSRDYSKSFHASVLCLNLEPSDLKKVSVSDTGVWGILNRTNGVYSFIPSNVGPSYAPNNAPQASKNAEVDNHTTEGEKVDSTQSQIANKASESNNKTTADSKEDEKATETVYADENTDKVDNHTTDEEITAGNSVKMRPEPSDSNTNTTDTPNNALQASKTSEVGSNTTNTEKVAPEQSQIANKASNAGVLDGLDGKTKAMIEELMKRDAAKNVTPMGRDYFKGAPDRWKEIHLKCAYAGGNNGDLLTIEEAIENYSSYESPRLHLDAIRTYAEEICKRMRNVLADNVITQEQFNAFSDVFKFKSEGYKAACAEEFKKNKPTTESEKWMYNWIYKKNKKNVKN